MRTDLKMKWLLRLLSILPIVTPPFVIGLALILLFGRSGMVTNWLFAHAGIPRSRWIYGFWGITIAQVLAFTPIAFMILAGVLEGISPVLEEAAHMLRASPWRTFRSVTWPLLRPGLTNAFLIGFVESLADFANPLVIGGSFNVLSTDIFFAVVGASHDQGKAAVLALILLFFTLIAFAAQGWWLGKARYTTVSGKGDSGLRAPLPVALRIGCLLATVPWIVLTLAIYGTIMVGGFVEQIGRDNTPTIKYFLTAFSIDHGVGGWFLSGSAWPSFLTTLRLGLVAMVATAVLGGSVTVPTLEGEVSLKIPQETQSGRVFRLRDKGVKPVRGGARGDLFCRVVVETPVNLTAEQRELLRKFDESLKRDGRSHTPREEGFFDGVKRFFSGR